MILTVALLKRYFPATHEVVMYSGHTRYVKFDGVTYTCTHAVVGASRTKPGVQGITIQKGKIA